MLKAALSETSYQGGRGPQSAFLVRLIDACGTTRLEHVLDTVGRVRGVNADERSPRLPGRQHGQDQPGRPLQRCAGDE
jgi:hypothetical protein